MSQMAEVSSSDALAIDLKGGLVEASEVAKLEAGFFQTEALMVGCMSHLGRFIVADLRA